MTCNRCNNAEARPGKKACQACADAAARRMRKVRVKGGDEHRRRQAQWTRQSEKRRRAAMLEAGTCLHCQCRPAEPGKKTCQRCLDIAAECERRRRKRRR